MEASRIQRTLCTLFCDALNPAGPVNGHQYSRLKTHATEQKDQLLFVQCHQCLRGALNCVWKQVLVLNSLQSIIQQREREREMEVKNMGHEYHFRFISKLKYVCQRPRGKDRLQDGAGWYYISAKPLQGQGTARKRGKTSCEADLSPLVASYTCNWLIQLTKFQVLNFGWQKPMEKEERRSQGSDHAEEHSPDYITAGLECFQFAASPAPHTMLCTASTVRLSPKTCLSTQYLSYRK